MNKITTAFLLLIATGIQCFAQSKPPKNNSEILTNATVIELHKAGLDDDLIISKIDNSAGSYDLTTSKLIELKKAGVSSSVLKALMAKSNGVNQKPNTHIQEVAKVSIELVNHPYFLDNGQYKPTEKATATMKTKSKMLGYGGTEVQYIIEGNKSPLRITSSDQISFIINTGGSALPDLTLYKLAISKNTRQAITQKINAFSLSPVKGTASLSFDVSRDNNGSFKLTPGKALDKGEYFFASKPTLSANSIDVYAFGID